MGQQRAEDDDHGQLNQESLKMTFFYWLYFSPQTISSLRMQEWTNVPKE